MVDLLGQKLRQSNELSPPKSRPRPLSPLSETFSVADGRRFSAAAISPRRPIPPQPATPLSPPAVAAGRRQTLAAENRCMLLAGLGEEAKRRQSVPNAGYLASPRDTKRHQLEQLRAWGHVYLGDAKSCDVFVQAMALRRPSDASSTSDNSAGDSSPTRIPTTPSLPAHQTAMRARIHCPRPVAKHASSGCTEAAVSGRLVSAQGRLSSAECTTKDVKQLGTQSAALQSRTQIRTVAGPVAWRNHYANSSFIRDVIDLPMPHPEAWASTVAYVYTGQGDVTDAVRENILYLAGKA
ncbi:hypothetical protein Cob_v006772 [Colletotrichum orbiculare MAFF 240422]|uniref:Uncharacterized protein n=1 Tax=Colletotrichum orbiculare (strain 104-T / ATCC 96160 / CBS 514.97 / LARS 414 / MAFF 240422) TaxID=1213857 RepID=A0A484FRG4_COLOR|nr:hypothetical protein Cob_v006772 [Colletotrichum orbiculare MAFF 240422]